jgi:hypothetical protein
VVERPASARSDIVPLRNVVDVAEGYRCCLTSPGPEHADTLNVRYGLARWTGEAGDPTGARDMLTELAHALEKVHGAEAPTTLNARSAAAFWARQAGDAVGA